MSDLDPDYCYVPNDWKGHRPVNRVALEHFRHGTVYAIPSATTMHFDLMRMLRKTKDEAYEDARLQGAGEPLITDARLHSVSIDNDGTGTITEEDK